MKIKFSYVELMQFQALYYPCIKYFCIFKKEIIDLPGNNFACDSLEDKYNKTQKSNRVCTSNIQTFVKSDGRQATFFLKT